jgi:hypothetical protein
MTQLHRGHWPLQEQQNRDLDTDQTSDPLDVRHAQAQAGSAFRSLAQRMKTMRSGWTESSP